MMWRLRKAVIVIFLFSLSARSQQAPEPAQPVITVSGLCNPAAPCAKTISREQFERLMTALNPNGQPVSAAARQNLGQTWAEYLALDSAAKKAGLEDTPEFRELVDWVRLRTVAEVYRRSLQEKFRAPTQQEIEAYYKQHLDTFERAHISRIFLPRTNPSAPRDPQFDAKALESAQDARRRAAQGEDPETIQKQIYSALSLDLPPATELGAWKRADFIEKEGEEIFSLKPGEVSQVETELHSYVIYKVTSRETLPLEQVKAEIVPEISGQKYADAMKSAIEAVRADFSEPYFGPGTALKPPAKPLKVPTTPPHH
jgi:parvulin-like peptidyl-prolyl isomerase